MADDSNLILQIQLQGGDEVKSGLTSIGNSGAQAFQNLTNSLNNLSNKLQGLQPGNLSGKVADQANQANSSVQGLATSIQSILGTLGSAFGSIIPIGVLAGAFSSVNSLFDTFRSSASDALKAVGVSANALGPIFKNLQNGVGAVVAGMARLTAFGAIGLGGLAGVGAALLGIAHSAADTVHSMEQLGAVSGESVQGVATLSNALVQMGARSETLFMSLRRLSRTMQEDFQKIQVASRDRATQIISDDNAVKSSALGLESAQLNLTKTQLDLQKAVNQQGRFPQANPTPTVGNTAADEAELALQQKYLAVDQAAQAVAEAQTKRAADLKKQFDDNINSVDGLIARVQGLGTALERPIGPDGLKALPLTVEQIREGITAMLTKANGGELPTATQYLRALADTFPHIGSGATRAALATAIFGRASLDMVTALSKGPAAFDAAIKSAHELGLQIGPEAQRQAQQFVESWGKLTGAFENFKTQAGVALFPAFIAGFHQLEDTLRTNREAIVAWAQSIVGSASQAIRDFFSIVSGHADEIKSGWVKDLYDAFELVKSVAVSAWSVVGSVLGYLLRGFNGLASALNAIAGTKLSGAELAGFAGALLLIGGPAAALARAIWGLVAAMVAIAPAALPAVVAIAPFVAAFAAGFIAVSAFMVAIGKTTWAEIGENIKNLRDQFVSLITGMQTVGTAGQSAGENASDALKSVGERADDAATSVEKLGSAFDDVGLAEQNASAQSGAGGAGFASGGLSRGPRGGYLSMLHGTEFVMRESAVNRFGVGFMNALNAGVLPHFAKGGHVGAAVGVGASAPHTLNLHMSDGTTFNGLRATDGLVRNIGNYAVRKSMVSTGKPSWYR